MESANMRGEAFPGTPGGLVPARPRTRTERAPRPVDRLAKPVVKPEVERAEIRAVLARAAADPSFIAELTYAPAAALEPYKLSLPARAALASGDIRWIEAHAGKLDARLRTWLDCRLQQEIW